MLAQRGMHNMEMKVNLITEIVKAIKVNIIEEPYAGKLHVRFCEGDSSSHI